MTTIDNQSWIFVHFYVVVGWKWMPILLALKHLVESGTVANIKKIWSGLFSLHMVVWLINKFLNILCV
jgi:hypothetical protein